MRTPSRGLDPSLLSCQLPQQQPCQPAPSLLQAKGAPLFLAPCALLPGRERGFEWVLAAKLCSVRLAGVDAGIDGRGLGEGTGAQ